MRPPHADAPAPGGRAGSDPHAHAHPPPVRLGSLTDGSLAPAIMAIVERGVHHRPALAHTLAAEIELVFDEGYPPVRIVFGEGGVLVEDGPAPAPALRIEGALPDQITLIAAPLVGGWPSPINARGRSALSMVALGRVRIEGRLALMRRFLRIIRI